MRKAVLNPERPNKSITMRIPVDVLEDLKRVAPRKGVTGYQGLIKLYIGQALRKDLAELREEEAAERARLILEKHTVAADVIDEVVAALKVTQTGQAIRSRAQGRNKLAGKGALMRAERFLVKTDVSGDEPAQIQRPRWGVRVSPRG